jgi:hypothetical protein
MSDDHDAVGATWKQSAGGGSGIIEEFANVRVKSQMATLGIAYLFGVPKW